LYEIIPGFLFATLAIVLVSLMGRGPSAVMLTRFDAAEKAFKSADR
jgi:sodium/proline symporter